MALTLYDHRWAPGGPKDPATRKKNTVVRVTGLTRANLPHLVTSIEGSRQLRQALTRQARKHKASHRYLLPLPPFDVIEALKPLAPLPELWILVPVFNAEAGQQLLVRAATVATALGARIGAVVRPTEDVTGVMERWLPPLSPSKTLLDLPKRSGLIEQLILGPDAALRPDPTYLYQVVELAHRRCPVFWVGWLEWWPFSEFSKIPFRQRRELDTKIQQLQLDEKSDHRNGVMWYPADELEEGKPLLAGRTHDALLWRTTAIWRT